MSGAKELSVSEVRALLDYDPETGVFRWRKRPTSMFTDGGHPAGWNAASWNRRFAGKQAGGEKMYRLAPYWVIRIKPRTYSAHRLAWLHYYGQWPNGDLDHIDGNGLNNRISNLRVATNGQNNANRDKQRNNTSGFKGVHWNKWRQRWHAQIGVDGRKLHIGLFDTPEEAAAAYAEEARKHFGEFARI